VLLSLLLLLLRASPRVLLSSVYGVADWSNGRVGTGPQLSYRFIFNLAEFCSRGSEVVYESITMHRVHFPQNSQRP